MTQRIRFLPPGASMPDDRRATIRVKNHTGNVRAKPDDGREGSAYADEAT